MDFFRVFNQLLLLFILLLIGYVVRKLKIFDDKITNGLSGFLVKVTLPALIISSMQSPFSPELLGQSGQILLISFLVYGISFLLALGLPYILKTPHSEKGVFRFMLMFSNVGFMGYPVLEVVFGKEALFYGAIYNLPFNLLVFTVGIVLLKTGSNTPYKVTWKTFVNPGVVAVMIGFALFLTSTSLPQAIGGAVDLLGSTTTPLSMIIIGSLLADIKISQIFGNWRVYIISTIRLLMLPLLVYAILSPFIPRSLMLGVPVIIAAMPAAANTALLAEEYEANPELASQGVFISTLLCMITIPIIAMLVV